MYILYTVAPILYRMASSAYYNISLLTSDFYGLLFGLFLFVRRITVFRAVYTLLITSHARLTARRGVLALLPRLHRCHPRAHHLLLERHAYVPRTFHLFIPSPKRG